jgi:hypothetical protein
VIVMMQLAPEQNTGGQDRADNPGHHASVDRTLGAHAAGDARDFQSEWLRVHDEGEPTSR